MSYSDVSDGTQCIVLVSVMNGVPSMPSLQSVATLSVVVTATDHLMGNSNRVQDLLNLTPKTPCKQIRGTVLAARMTRRVSYCPSAYLNANASRYAL
jgi:hypothetical protein